MRRLVAVLAFLSALVTAGFAEEIRVTTWNLEWFPSGSPKVASPEVESARIKAAAKIITILNPDVLLLQEVRNWDACQKLADALAPTRYHVNVCSTFRDGFGVGQQQVAILSKIPANSAWAEKWKTVSGIDPPRGMAFAIIPFQKREVAFYSLHLKSNLVRSGSEREAQVNIVKRELAAEQTIAHSKEMAKSFPGLSCVVVAGDFNTNRQQDLFISERTLPLFESAGFADPGAKLPFANAVTHPGKGRYPDAIFDYVFSRGFKNAGVMEILKTTASDHYPVTVTLDLP